MACGSSSSAADDSPKLLTSQQDLCAGAPPDYGDHVVTMISCPFVQHTENVAKYGEELAAGSALYDATGSKVASVTHTCDTWAVGTDQDGVTIIVRRDTGAVTSHGMQHPGQATSKLTTLALPLQIR
jgi:hypothetical protein